MRNNGSCKRCGGGNYLTHEANRFTTSTNINISDTTLYCGNCGKIKVIYSTWNKENDDV